MPRLERIPTAAGRMGVSPSQVYREIKAGRIGPLVKLGERASALPAEAVDAWIAERIAEASQPKGGAE
ncbi:helix-turn-helix transcriptional regulator [Rhodocyclus tenuis]|uniref:Prophage regulatory protein n=1 Tax=Rhodocyclus tenuis TaxID=1066 RepID=A0A840GDB9_RHOTE|nr:AlpA family phage regulatory protein [Rhodocyclus tenuis]MBB4246239.1 prophage regulatory protein [Rhodocyclus tenuis]